MLRAVVDPGVLIAALLSPSGTPARLLKAWRDGLFELIISPRLLDELGDALRRAKFRRYLTEHEAATYVNFLRAQAVVRFDPSDIPSVTPDPDDDYLVALARSATADCLVSGDKHLTSLPRIRPPVVTPRQFLRIVTRSTGPRVP